MRASEFSPANHVFARATSGGRLDIRYDARTNALVFIEDDWSSDARGAAAPRQGFREQLGTSRAGRRLRDRRLTLVS